ncbi:MAG: 50S ribosomal protein L3 [Deltaproteobacteria bacterium]|jgi:large subunit ribosomal protein L3|nr:50S ribosomal protein L3 [Deltaproteobacteria bacterium]MBT4088911.1 50S ribosomal protein L3 [Deltaproteobacteria bacterium]MBT4640029.1 50S ribosomal protein L3 [Deltaproteobacteria bacterium]MBT6610524.1 50S ribosomal protein L3 [Deltaproteobacteria bacterium]MBT7153198.1 50S ribosomal protein L3 [Deltaproteobacteria bacterium]
MLNGLFGKKVGMTQFFTEDGDRVPVTVVKTDPVKVIQKKTVEKDGYKAVQVGIEELTEAKRRNVTKPLKGHFKDQTPTRYLRELAAGNDEEIEVGQTIDLSMFTVGDLVDVTGTSKGHGFSGVMKRHNFSGGPAAHGHRFNRGTGSIGQSATPAKIFKNKKMAGQYGNAQVTVQRLEIVEIKEDLNVILIKGAIPGPNGRLVEVKKTAKPKK